MSEMREHLQATRDSYRGAAYPGDLAADVLPARKTFWPRIIATLVAGAAAAILVMVLLNQAIEPGPGPQVDRIAATQRQQMELILPALPQMPAMPVMPASMTPRFDAPMLLPSLPSFPSLSGDLNLDTNFQSPTTQESL